MYAPLPVSDNESRIRICFGQKITSQNNPFQLDLQLGLFSQKHQNYRSNLQQKLQIKIKETTVLFEITAKNGLGSQLAEKTMNYLKTCQQYIKRNKSDDKLTIQAIGKDKNCYIFLNSNTIVNKWSKQFHYQLTDLKNKYPNVQKQNNQIKLQIKSLNSCDFIRKLLDNQGIPRAFFDSLDVQMKFQKTKLIEALLIKIFCSKDGKQLTGLFKTFKKMNLNIKFASSSEQDRYQNLRVCLKKKDEKESFPFLKQIKGQFKDEINLKILDPYFSIFGQCKAENSISLVEAFFD